MPLFSEFSLLPQIQHNLQKLGFTQPTEIQAKVIPHLLAHPQSDIHAQAQTGTGKTFAFGIPLLHIINPSNKVVQALIAAPTRELVLQISESLQNIAHGTGITIEPIYGGMPINKQINAIKHGAQIIVGTPGRLNDHLRRKTVSLHHLKVLVLDEADIMLDMGFREEVNEILKHTPVNRQIWLFSATVLSGIQDLIRSHMKNVVTIKATTPQKTSTQIKQYFCVTNPRKRSAIVARFIEASPDFYGIIFCRTKILSSHIAEELTSRGFRANCLHGDMSQSLRNQVIQGFRDREFNILVATDVAARGIDVSDLTHVINFSIPDEPESYIHRIGRTGRAGKQGIAIMLIAPSEMHRIRRLEKMTSTIIEEIAVPPLEAIIKTKMIAASDFIEQARQPHQKLLPVHQAIRELIADFTEEEVRHSLTVALEDKFFKDIINEDLTVEKRPEHRERTGREHHDRRWFRKRKNRQHRR